jgi:hypothetical protein
MDMQVAGTVLLIENCVPTPLIDNVGLASLGIRTAIASPSVAIRSTLSGSHQASAQSSSSAMLPVATRFRITVVSLCKLQSQCKAQRLVQPQSPPTSLPWLCPLPILQNHYTTSAPHNQHLIPTIASRISQYVLNTSSLRPQYLNSQRGRLWSAPRFPPVLSCLPLFYQKIYKNKQ